MRERVLAAHHIQEKRFAGQPFRYNSQIPGRDVERYCGMGAKEYQLLQEVSTQMDFSARACHRLMKVARTIADLEQSEWVEESHLYEALLFKMAEIQQPLLQE